MQNTTDEVVAALERDFPAYQVWCVSVYIGPDRWCARPWSAAHADIVTENISADSAAELRKLLEEAAS
jgi:hypothetical protein